MTADHGGGMIPELHGKLRVDFDPLVASLKSKVKAAGGDPKGVDFESGGFFVDPTKLGNGPTAEALTTEFITAARRVDGVERVDRFADLADADLAKLAVMFALVRRRHDKAFEYPPGRRKAHAVLGDICLVLGFVPLEVHWQM